MVSDQQLLSQMLRTGQWVRVRAGAGVRMAPTQEVQLLHRRAFSSWSRLPATVGLSCGHSDLGLLEQSPEKRLSLHGGHCRSCRKQGH